MPMGCQCFRLSRVSATANERLSNPVNCPSLPTPNNASSDDLNQQLFHEPPTTSSSNSIFCSVPTNGTIIHQLTNNTVLLGDSLHHSLAQKEFKTPTQDNICTSSCSNAFNSSLQHNHSSNTLINLITNNNKLIILPTPEALPSYPTEISQLDRREASSTPTHAKRLHLWNLWPQFTSMHSCPGKQ